jgi:hypothetical protein
VVREPGNKSLDWIIELEAAFVEEKKNRAGCHELRIRVDPEDVIKPKRYPRLLARPSDAYLVY